MKPLTFLVIGLSCLLLRLVVSDRDGLSDRIFPTDCESQQKLREYISCEDDGSFSPIQCKWRKCRCVDPSTGYPINESGVLFSQEDPNIDCITVFPEEDPCQQIVSCFLSCTYGFKRSDSSCPVCECKSLSDTSNDTDSTEVDSNCPTVDEIVADGCLRGCIMRSNQGCPLQCNESCSTQGDDRDDECRSDGSCESFQVCRAVGQYGQHICVNLLDEGERCDEVNGDDERFARDRIAGAADRFALSLVRSADVGCRPGLVCTRVGLDRRECRPVNENGTCVRASDDPIAECRDDGGYRPLQCRRRVNGDRLCRCVYPDGTQALANTTEPDEIPDCDDIVYDRCEFEVGGFEYDARHGEYFVNPDNCSKCLCQDGEGVFCSSVDDCGFIKSAHSCEINGEEIPHGGDVFEVDCNKCGCRNGRIRCTRRNCDDNNNNDDNNNDDNNNDDDNDDDDDDDDDDNDDDNDDDGDDDNDGSCSSCRTQRRSPVCAPDGRTYQSRCYAIFCAGHSPAYLLRGPCTSYDVCELYPCNETEICLRRGGVSCFNRDGCDPEDVRLCVNPSNLVCTDDADNTEPGYGEQDSYVCGTNRKSYPSICRMVQDTLGTEQVSYAGRCDRDDCSGGPVCGTDGVTYDNVCVLRSRSNARVDYPGACDPEVEIPLGQLCQKVRSAGRCRLDHSNCDYLVRPEEGCCALCGCVLTVAIDFSALGEYVELNPHARTVDGLLEILVESGFIPKEATDRCKLEAQFTNVGDFEITLSAHDEDTDAQFCHAQCGILVNKINSPSTGGADAVPEVLQFANAAVSAPLVVEDDGGSDDGGSEDGAVQLSLSTLALVSAYILAALFF